MVQTMDFACVYRITNTATGLIYVGSARNLRKRWYMHRWELRAGRHGNRRMQRSFAVHGEAVFVLDVLERVDSNSQLIVREQHWMDALRVFDKSVGYNFALNAGSTLGCECSGSTRKKIGDANRGRKYTGEKLARKQAAARAPEQIARLQAITRSDDLRAAVSRTKGRDGCVFTRATAERAVALYESGEFSIKAIAAEIGTSYAATFKVIHGQGPKGARVMAANNIGDARAIRQRIARTLTILTPLQDAEIRDRRRNGEFQNALAREFCVCTATISRIINQHAERYCAPQ